MPEDQPDCSNVPTPGAEHAALAELVGTWDVSCEYFMAPGEEPMKNQAVEVVEGIGAFWTRSTFTCEFMGAPFMGCATVGFEPRSGEWVSTWTDSMMPHLFVFRGSADAEGTITMIGKGPSPATGELVDYRTVERTLDPDSRQFEMFFTAPGGSECQMARYAYTRRR